MGAQKNSPAIVRYLQQWQKTMMVSTPFQGFRQTERYGLLQKLPEPKRAGLPETSMIRKRFYVS
jgi:hypothetical protein